MANSTYILLFYVTKATNGSWLSLIRPAKAHAVISLLIGTKSDAAETIRSQRRTVLAELG
ncbi:MAG: hypothetical protein NW206_10400 [Hyphomonadaceae bacterium]|nr:hypothetical protein [Hyphomonadaceae bacterium]